MLFRIVLIVVYAHNNGDVFVLSRCRNEDLLRTRFNVLMSSIGIGEETGRFDDQLYTQIPPWKIEWIAIRQNANGPAINDDGIAINDDLIEYAPMDREYSRLLVGASS